jgi:quercetin dioxygenase-like cupin family protein
MQRLILLSLIFCCSLIAQSQYNKGVLLEPLLKTDTTSIGQQIIYPDYTNSEVSILKVTIPSGKSTGWHKHIFPVFGYVIQGTLTVEIENRKAIQYTKGSSFSEVISSLHNGVNNGAEDVVLIAFFMGEKGKALSTH